MGEYWLFKTIPLSFIIEHYNSTKDNYITILANNYDKTVSIHKNDLKHCIDLLKQLVNEIININGVICKFDIDQNIVDLLKELDLKYIICTSKSLTTHNILVLTMDELLQL